MNIRTDKILLLIAMVIISPVSAFSGDELVSDSNSSAEAVRPDPHPPANIAVPYDDSTGVSPPVENLAASSRDSALPARPHHEGVSRDIFDSHSWYTPPPPAPKQNLARQVKREPTAPPLPFTYLGSYEQAGSPTLYFLTKNDRIYDVVVGDTLENMYTVDGVTNGQLMFTYLPLNASQGLRLGEPE